MLSQYLDGWKLHFIAPSLHQLWFEENSLKLFKKPNYFQADVSQYDHFATCFQAFSRTRPCLVARVTT